MYGSSQDITERKQAEEALRASEELLSRTQKIAHTGSWKLDLTTNRLTWSDEVYRIFGCEPQEFVATYEAFLDFVHPDDRAAVDEAYSRSLQEGSDSYEIEHRIVRRKSGEVRYVHERCVHERDAAGTIIQSTGMVQDITERKQAEETIRQMAYHDPLTGLPNRKLFSDRLGVALAQAGRSQNNVAVIMLDLDNFKDVNDTMGHDMGDLLLKAVTERLSEALRKYDTVARFGGDEFVLTFPELKGTEDAIPVAQRIVESFRKPFPINTHQLIVTASIGIAVYPDAGSDEVALLKNADIAMYQAKQAGRDRYQVFKKR